MKKNRTDHSNSRRKFLKNSALAASSFMIVPRHVLGKGFIPPSDKLNIAGIGVGGMGAANLRNLAPTENIVALCDVDDAYAAKTYETYPNAKRHKDYRKMLEQQKDIDAVVIATPDHLHAVQTVAAMKAGKHVYVQKPLTYTLHEARELAKLAKAMPKIVTQMGNQGHSNDDARLINEIIAADMIGKVTEVHVWTNRPIWPQGIAFPTDAPATPLTLDWDLFLGPAQPRTYNPAYHPFKWRGWVDYGVGALGDMGAHLIDHPVWALGLGAPTHVEASSSQFNGQTYPVASIVYYDFAARGKMPAVRLTWYDGGLLPERPKELLPEEKIDRGGGVLYIGSKGKLMHDTYGSKPRLLPTTKMQDFKAPKQLFPRVGMSHERNWAEACKGNGKANCPFDYAGPLTETMLLGVMALRMPGQKLTWDSANMQFPGTPDLNQYVTRTYRSGFEL
ncbi:Gfo/Idh/MocA family oxidoreductase [Cytophagaceae bacterium YF14B1]|uniref:Gfo/Idh/MocA family oxidoreductase n=1 Tax=Xanthocytophaga flava TaxID=3048013 RepID=A0AAE3U992_9BACT|nr:Gfo/Idh/MocA family oxidoreductase [Xanthocytophaga flavus]MDJ1482013.1 Gfo/Idh/MocA family oxidoreductase [Xanthocytophaga flavus]